MKIDTIRELWSAGPAEAAQAARLIDTMIPVASRPAWAADLLEVACSRLPDVPARVRAVLAIGRSRRWWGRNRWREAHAAFGAVRELTMAEDRFHAGGKVYAAVLAVAEYAAKVIYNASGVAEPVEPGVPAPFDDDCGCHLVGSLWHVVRACGSPAFDRQAWATLASWLR